MQSILQEPLYRARQQSQHGRQQQRQNCGSLHRDICTETCRIPPQRHHRVHAVARRAGITVAANATSASSAATRRR